MSTPADRLDGVLPPARAHQILDDLGAVRTTCHGPQIYGECYHVQWHGETWALDQWAYASWRADCLTCDIRDPPPGEIEHAPSPAGGGIVAAGLLVTIIIVIVRTAQ